MQKYLLFIGSICLGLLLLFGVSTYHIYRVDNVSAQEDAIPAGGEGKEGDAKGGDQGGEGTVDGVDAGETDSQQSTGYREMNGYAWSSNIGWIKFNGTASNGQTYKVLVDAQTGAMSGYAWTPNLGWLSFNSGDSSVCGTAAKYNKSGNSGTITGYAVFLSGKGRTDGWDGCMKFSGSSYGVTTTESGSQATLAGYSWGSEVDGWNNMCGTGYCVTIDDSTEIPLCLAPSTPITSGANAGKCQCPLPGGSIINPGESCPDYTTPPSATTLSALTGSSCGTISLSWSAVTGADHYILYGKASGAASFSTIDTNINNTVYTTTGLTGSYSYKVVAVNAVGVLGAESNVATAVAGTSACIPPPSAAIGDFYASPLSVPKDTACTIRWTGVTANDSCTIYRGSIATGNAVYTLPLNSSGNPADGSTVIDASLQATTRYVMQCRDDAQGYASSFTQKQTQCNLAPIFIEF